MVRVRRVSERHGAYRAPWYHRVNSQSKCNSGARSGSYFEKDFMAAFSVRNHTGKEPAMKSQQYQHLTYEQRIEIQQCLAYSMSFKDIGKRRKFSVTPQSPDYFKCVGRERFILALCDYRNMTGTDSQGGKRSRVLTDGIRRVIHYIATSTRSPKVGHYFSA